MITQLTSQLEKHFGSLSKTLFFEYQSIAALTGYFLDNYKASLIKLMGVDEMAPVKNKKTETSHITENRQQTFSGHGHSPGNLRSRSRYIAAEPVVTKPDSNALDIAIIGVSGRYPQARNLDEFWDNLRNGKDCITEVPKERWDWREYYSEDRTKPGCHYSKWGGFLDGVDEFDPQFFNISPREAAIIDPQERLFLEQAWAALEDAGYCREDLQKIQGEYLSAPVGVYAGVMYGEYQLLGAEASMQGDRKGFAGILANIANRVSYVFNLHGPSMTVDTMCSGSLTALHLACQDLKQGRTDLGIAGGVNVTIHPNKYLMLSSGQFISTAGHCESFGKGGDGYIPGEGVGVVLLKRLADAERDGDHIYGVVKSSAVNHGGKTNGYTVPNPNVQQMAITSAIKEAGIDPGVIGYIEAHGTGTKLGDPIEIAGLSKAFGRCTEKQFCRIGSVKSNIGHCESAAGIAGLTKVLLQMKHGQIVPSLHSETLNPNIDFSTTPFVVNQRLTDWNRLFIDGEERPRLAGISAFGAGGSNVHVVVEEYIPKKKMPLLKDTVTPAPVVIVLSAKNEVRLNDYVREFIKFLGKEGSYQPGIESMAYTLQTGREAMEERLALVVASVAELREKLSAFISGQEDIDALYRGRVKKADGTFIDLDTDEDMKKTIDNWIIKGKHKKLADLWSKGVSIDWHMLYGDAIPGRVSLPTYPFARDRYWATDKKPVASDINGKRENNKKYFPKKPEKTGLSVNVKNKTAGSGTTIAAKDKSASPGVTLADPMSQPGNFRYFSPVKKPMGPTVTLADLASFPAESTENSTDESVECHEYGEGVFEVRINDAKNNNLLSKQMLNDLHKVFNKICQDKKSKVVLLMGQEQCFLSSDAKQQFAQEELDRLITGCEIPVIAVMKGDATGMGWLVGILCDFMVFSEEGIYRYHPDDSERIPESQEQLFVSKRFGKEIALQLLYSREQHAGKELKEKGMKLPVLPKKELDSYAIKMAHELAEYPREALLQLKKHLGSERRSFGEKPESSWKNTFERE
ncbi:MAG TPA: hypothetical protein ENK04_12045, partial [Gammaproteobacteria bacterium]|nr:hypothetical protein [Gammaproteobacteria bacterium]